MIAWICSGIIILLIVLYILTFSYKKEERKNIDRDIHKLWFLYGLAMFLADRYFRKMIHHNSQVIEEKFRSLYVKDKVAKDKYLYIVSKLALAVTVVFFSAVIGIMSEISSVDDRGEVKELIRNEYGEGDISYILEADDEEGKEEIKIDVPQIEIDDQEALKILEGYKDELTKQMLGENESQNRITKPLNLINSIGKENVQISWEIEDDTVIGYDGSIGEGVAEDGTLTKLYATMSLKKVNMVQEIELDVYPSEEMGNVQHIVQNIVNNYDVWAKKIPLPENINNKKTKFYEKTDCVSYAILWIGIIAAVVIFFLKDRELDKKIKERNSQMILDYPEIVNKLMLFNRAGMSMRKAWQRTIESSGVKQNHYVYREMKMTLMKINSGIPEITAYEQFGKRCKIHCYIRFTNIINQNLKRGSGEMFKAFQYEIQNALLEKKNNALKRGEEAGTKLLAPMVIMLIVGLVIIVAPAFMSIKF